MNILTKRPPAVETPAPPRRMATPKASPKATRKIPIVSGTHVRAGKTSQYLGVSLDQNRRGWVAQFKTPGTKKVQRRFPPGPDQEIMAATFYDNIVRKFAPSRRVNFPRAGESGVDTPLRRPDVVAKAALRELPIDLPVPVPPAPAAVTLPPIVLTPQAAGVYTLPDPTSLVRAAIANAKSAGYTTIQLDWATLDLLTRKSA